MRLFKGLFAVTAFSALAAFSVGCGETENGGPDTCIADADCGEGEACHPTAKICLQTCEQTSDCTDQTQANCGPVKNPDGTDSTVKFCRCSTDPLCNEDDTTDLICSTLSNACTEKCTSNADCSNFGSNAVCDTASGQCEIQEPTTCTTDDDCTDAALPYCDTASGTCVATQPVEKCDPTDSTIGANGGQSICAAGEYCNAAQECVAAQGTCAAATAYGNKSTGASPVIYNIEITGTRTAPEASCTGGKVTQFRGQWYDAEGDVPTSGVYSKINRISKAGVKAPTYEKVSVTKNADGKSGTFTFEMCDDQKGTAEAVVLADSANNESNVACFPAW